MQPTARVRDDDRAAALVQEVFLRLSGVQLVRVDGRERAQRAHSFSELVVRGIRLFVRLLEHQMEVTEGPACLHAPVRISQGDVEAEFLVEQGGEQLYRTVVGCRANAQAGHRNRHGCCCLRPTRGHRS